MGGEWRVGTLRDAIGEKGYIRGPFGSSLRRPELKSSGVPVYEQQHAINGTREFRFYIDEEKYKTLKRFTVQPNDLIISCSGTLARVSMIQPKDPVGIISQALLILRPDTTVVWPRYLYYFMSSKQGFASLVGVSTGSVQVNIAGRSIIEQIELPLPPLPEQRAIAHILGTLDDKIELNRRMNQTLEEMARAIFKSWFVDFDPVRAKAAVRREHPDWSNAQVSRAACPTLKPEIAELFPEEFENSELGEIPKGWRVGRLPESIDFLEGPGLRSVQYRNEGMRFLNIRCISEGDLDIEKANCISFEEFEMKYSHFALREDDIVISTSGTLGRLAIVRDDHLPLMLNTSIIRMRGRGAVGLSYVWGFLQSGYFLSEMLAYAAGSVQLNFGPIHLRQILFLRPTDDMLLGFEWIVQPLLRKSLHIRKESRTLAALRDTLLPKLISGELRVKDAERFLKE